VLTKQVEDAILRRIKMLGLTMTLSQVSAEWITRITSMPVIKAIAAIMHATAADIRAPGRPTVGETAHAVSPIHDSKESKESKVTIAPETKEVKLPSAPKHRGPCKQYEKTGQCPHLNEEKHAARYSHTHVARQNRKPKKERTFADVAQPLFVPPPPPPPPPAIDPMMMAMMGQKGGGDSMGLMMMMQMQQQQLLQQQQQQQYQQQLAKQMQEFSNSRRPRPVVDASGQSDWEVVQPKRLNIFQILRRDLGEGYYDADLAKRYVQKGKVVIPSTETRDSLRQKLLNGTASPRSN